MPHHCFVRYLFFKQVRVTMETSRVMMEKRKASSESAEADKQYLGKSSRDMAVICIRVYIHFITLIICVCFFSGIVVFLNNGTSTSTTHAAVKRHVVSPRSAIFIPTAADIAGDYSGQCFCCMSVFEVRRCGVRTNSPPQPDTGWPKKWHIVVWCGIFSDDII